MEKKLKQGYYMEILLQEPKSGAGVLQELDEEAAKQAMRFHRSIPQYQETPLVSLEELSKRLGVKGIYVKNESLRFGLKAFKGLGGTYAMFRILCRELKMDVEKADFRDFQEKEQRERAKKITFVTATDGNHGKGVSWAAGLFGCQAHVFMPKGSSEMRAEAIRSAGPATVQVTDKNYDETVQYARQMSEKYGWFLIQDTAWDGYEEIPLWIIQGYLTMASEAVKQLEERKTKPTHIFLQAGVGAMAGGVAGYLLHHYGKACPVISVVEPKEAACIFLSARENDGACHTVEGDPETIMAGLNCQTPCKITWPVLRDFSSACIVCPDFAAAHGMRLYAKPSGNDEPVVSGESGAVTLGAFALLMERTELKDVKKQLGLGADSVILLFNTEGDTDPVCYQNIVRDGAYPLE